MTDSPPRAWNYPLASPPPSCPHGTAYAQPCCSCGWTCPACGRCYAPWVRECNYRHEENGPERGSVQPEILTPIVPVPLEGPAETAPAIFVPLRAGARVTPSRIADIQHMLTYVAPGEVDGKFIVLPPGAKTLPASVRRSLAAAVPEMAGPHYERMSRLGSQWREIFPGLQCCLSGFIPDAGAPLDPGALEVILRFRLTPQDAG